MGAYSEQEQHPPLLLPRDGSGRSSRQSRRENEEIEKCVSQCCTGLGALLFVAILGAMIWLLWFVIRDPPQYFVAIDAASGLNYNATAATAGSTVPAIDPVFDLTVRIASKSRDVACLHPTTSAHVSYMGVQLAAERVPPGLCAAPWKSKDRSVVARGKAVAMSGFLMDTLTEDVRNGEAVFVVRLLSPRGSYWNVITCRAKIGDAGALEAPCSSSRADAKEPMPYLNQVRGADE